MVVRRVVLCSVRRTLAIDILMRSHLCSLNELVGVEMLQQHAR